MKSIRRSMALGVMAIVTLSGCGRHSPHSSYSKCEIDWAQLSDRARTEFPVRTEFLKQCMSAADFVLDTERCAKVEHPESSPRCFQSRRDFGYRVHHFRD